MVWPLVFYLIKVALLDKPGGDSDRPVCLLPLPYRVWNVVRSGILQEWEGDNSMHYDWAQKGRGALAATYQDELFNEMAVATKGVEIGGCLQDMTKFFDPLDA